MMTLIFCSEKCIHQAEGCCTLNTAAAVTNTGTKGCIHQEKPLVSSLYLNRPMPRRPL